MLNVRQFYEFVKMGKQPTNCRVSVVGFGLMWRNPLWPFKCGSNLDPELICGFGTVANSRHYREKSCMLPLYHESFGRSDICHCTELVEHSASCLSCRPDRALATIYIWFSMLRGHCQQWECIQLATLLLSEVVHSFSSILSESNIVGWVLSAVIMWH